jgi:predicted metal-dependent hydrolase
MLSEQLQLFRLPSPPAAAKTRHLLISGRIVDYRLKSGAKRLTMTIDERGLRIGAPQRISLIEIEAFVHEHGEWVLKKLAELAHATQPRHVAVRDGTRLPLLDGEAEVRVLPGANRVRWIGDPAARSARRGRPRPAGDTRPAETRVGAFRRTPGALLPGLLGLPTPKLSLSSAHTRWGSCSKHGGIRINWRLIHLPTHLGDYVVAHEVAHLLEMNHSKRFWAVVGSIYPDWKIARVELKQRTTSLPIL